MHQNDIKSQAPNIKVTFYETDYEPVKVISWWFDLINFQFDNIFHSLDLGQSAIK